MSKSEIAASFAASVLSFGADPDRHVTEPLPEGSFPRRGVSDKEKARRKRQKAARKVNRKNRK